MKLNMSYLITMAQTTQDPLLLEVVHHNVRQYHRARIHGDKKMQRDLLVSMVTDIALVRGTNTDEVMDLLDQMSRQ